MSVVPVTFYKVQCDRCGCFDDEGEYAAWADADQAIQVAVDSDWLQDGDRHYCDDCTEWDEEKDERVPKAVETTA